VEQYDYSYRIYLSYKDLS